jgi:hypothetical protein
MKTRLFRISLFVSALMLLVMSCNKESYIESIGSVTIQSGEDTEVGYFIFTTKTAAGACGKVTIYIDDKVVGYLTSDYSGTVNKCTEEPIEGRLLKVVMPVGAHKVTASVANNCRSYNVDNYTLKKGVCRYYNLN